MNGTEYVELEHLRKLVDVYKNRESPERLKEAWENGWYSHQGIDEDELKDVRIKNEMYHSFVESIIREEMMKLGMDDEYCKNQQLNIDLDIGDLGGEYSI